MFDSLMYAKKLEEAGLTREQAEAHVQMLTDVVNSNLATRQDLKDLRGDLRADIARVRTELKTEIAQVRTELKTEIAEVRTELKAEIADLRNELRAETAGLHAEMRALEYRMTIKLGTIVSLAIGVAVTLAKVVG